MSNISHPTFEHITSGTHPEFTIDFVGALCYDPINKGIWIGSNRGIYFYDIKIKKLISPFPFSVTKNILGTIGSLIDKKNKLWIGTSDGAMIIDLKSFARSHSHFSYKYLKYKSNKPDSHCVDKINCLYESSNGTIWLGSNGYGLYKLLSRDNENY